MLGHFHARWRQVEHPPLGLLPTVRLVQRRHVLLDVVRVVGLPQSRAWMPARAAAGALRKPLRGRLGLRCPSLEGGLSLLELFIPTFRSNSAKCCFTTASSARKLSFSAR